MFPFVSILLVGLIVLPEVFAQSGCGATHRDVLGPYYLHGVPYQRLVCSGGPYLLVTGTVRDTTCSVITGATLEVWQADSSGHYFMDTRRLNFCRGKVITDPQGRYSFITIMPGKYGWGWYTRPAHVHFRVTAPGRRTLVTQMYFSGDSSLGVHDPCGFCGSENPSQVAEPRAPSGDEGSYTVGGTSYTISEVAEWDIVLN
ncbi:catechol 1,2-dioxygenase-like [Branchiostoma floridae]|uniref:Catechol 1,2-dioxygenase-like n=1 Tax=Branchiostoma floridae TaxID=7739 RepID=A0A9J7HPL5_BRAFL|nr:catechol 1,2-dioxygenase-like [Branchiostoma floridae]